MFQLLLCKALSELADDQNNETFCDGNFVHFLGLLYLLDLIVT